MRIASNTLAALALALGPLALVSHAQGWVDDLDPPATGLNSFGEAMTASGEWAAFNGRLDADVTNSRVFLYHRQGGAWQYHGELVPAEPLPGLYFGVELDMDGDRLAVGAPGSGDDGAVYIYARQGTTWSLEQILESNLWGILTLGGWGLALAGDQLAVGLLQSGWGRGVTFFERGTSWTENGPAIFGDYDEELFATRIDMDGETLLIGSPRSESDTGSAYIYEKMAGAWAETQRLQADDWSQYDSFGTSVALDGDRCLIGSPGFGLGAAFIFERTANGWEQEGPRLDVPVAESYGVFGVVGALRGDLAIVGAAGWSDTGAIYTYHRQAGTWRATARYTSNSPSQDGAFGRKIVIEGDSVFVNEPFFWDSFTGPVAVFDMPSEVIPFNACRNPVAPCKNGDFVAGCETSLGEGATLRAQGSPSVAQDDLVFRMAPLPANQFGILYMGGASILEPLGDGMRVVGGGSTGTFRFPVRSTGASGEIVEGPGIVAHSQSFGAAGTIQPGASWYFQGWMRDPSGPCGTGFNLTQGVRVRFLP